MTVVVNLADVLKVIRWKGGWGEPSFIGSLPGHYDSERSILCAVSWEGVSGIVSIEISSQNEVIVRRPLRLHSTVLPPTATPLEIADEAERMLNLNISEQHSAKAAA